MASVIDRNAFASLNSQNLKQATIFISSMDQMQKSPTSQEVRMPKPLRFDPDGGLLVAPNISLVPMGSQTTRHFANNLHLDPRDMYIYNIMSQNQN